MTSRGLKLATLYQRVRDAFYTWLIRGGFHSFGASSRIMLPFRTGGSAQIDIGEKVLVGPMSWIVVPFTLQDGVVLHIHDRVRMNQTTVSAVHNVTIESGVELARGVYISDHSHGFGDGSIPIRDQPLEKIAPVLIGRGSWLGQNVVVLPGVTIGAGSVVGANSVVRTDIPPRSVAAGVPAKVIRMID